MPALWCGDVESGDGLAADGEQQFVRSPVPAAFANGWDFTDSYEVRIKPDAFGAAGFGRVEMAWCTTRQRRTAVTPSIRQTAR